MSTIEDRKEKTIGKYIFRIGVSVLLCLSTVLGALENGQTLVAEIFAVTGGIVFAICIAAVVHLARKKDWSQNQ
ncbi:MAG: hypothetical protein M1368_02250 [Thaumarchaeota archaeon]|nr:hypothetical protein [Nitrososphaerota archaeon]